MLACYEHVYVKLDAWGLVCPKNRESNHMFFPFISEQVAKQPPPVMKEPEKKAPPVKEAPEKKEAPVGAATEKEGFVEGQKLGVAFTALLGGPQPHGDIRALNYLGRTFSRWAGLSGDPAFGFVDGFITGVIQGDSSKKIAAPKSAADGE